MLLLVQFEIYLVRFSWHVALCVWFIELCESRTHSKPVSWARPPGSRNSDVAFRGRLWPIKGSRFQLPGPNEARRRGSSLSSWGMLGWKWRRGGGLQWEAASWMGQGHLIGSFQGHHGTVISSPDSLLQSPVLLLAADGISHNLPASQSHQSRNHNLIKLSLGVRAYDCTCMFFVPPQGNVNGKHAF